MGKLEDEFVENDPEMKDISDAAIGRINKRLDTKAADIEKAMLAEIATFKKDSSKELEDIKSKLDALTNLDAAALQTKTKDLQNASKALGDYLDKREQRFKSLGSKLGTVVKSKLPL